VKRLLSVALLGFGVAACTQPAAAPPPQAAPPPSSAIVDSVKQEFTSVKGYLTKSLEQFPEKDLAFKPVGVAAEVRGFGQIIAHVAAEQYLFCGPVSGEKKPPVDEKSLSKLNKADLQKALADAFAFCDRAFASVNDQTGAAAAEITEFSYKSTKIGLLAFNNAHDYEHYGNLVTYMRAKKMVPPSSQPSK